MSLLWCCRGDTDLKCFGLNEGRACACVGYEANTTHCSPEDVPKPAICRDRGDICSCVSWGCSREPASAGGAPGALCSCRLGSSRFAEPSCAAPVCCFDP